MHKGKTIAEHTEHTVIFLPDIWSVVPAMMDYLSLQASYKHSLLIKLGQLCPKDEPEPEPPGTEDAPAAAAATPAVPEATVAVAEPMETSQSQALIIIGCF